jgi:hypothetical protein
MICGGVKSEHHHSSAYVPADDAGEIILNFEEKMQAVTDLQE